MNMNELIKDIKSKTKNQIAINKADEVRVMRTMLNDPEFTIGVYERNTGYVGDRSPYHESREFVKHVIMGATGLDGQDSEHLANNYEFQKRDAIFLIDNARDFVQTYLSTGRKFTLMQSGATEADIFTKVVPSGTKQVPDKSNPGTTKETYTSTYIKLVSKCKSPKYND